MKIEREFVTLKMTGEEARALHCLVCAAINARECERRVEPDGDEAHTLETLKRFDDRLHEIFYKFRQN